MQKIHSEFLEIDRKERARVPSLEIHYRAPSERVCDFEEVNLPLSPWQAKFEASRCIECPEPAACVRACPVNNDIPTAMWLISQGKFLEAADVYRQTSSLPEVCGRVCPHEQLCEGSCVQSKHADPVRTGALEAWVMDYQRQYGAVDNSVPEPNGHKVAIVGSGPSGLAAAEQLAKKGYEVTIFEALPFIGGLLLYGIPNFKLCKNMVLARISDFYEMGVKMETEVRIGKDKTVDDLFAEGYEAVYVAVGTWNDANMGIPGEDLAGVYRGSEYLMRCNVKPDLLPKNFEPGVEDAKKVMVIGGGDTASDCLRTALRIGAEEVNCLYRRTEREMPGSAKDRRLAREEGADYLFLTQPVKFIGNEKGHLKEIECVKMELGAPDESGRRRPVPIEGSNFTIKADIAVLGLGYWPDEKFSKDTPNLETHKYGLIVTDPKTCKTSIEGVFAGGDAVTGPDLVVTAMATGRKAAASIDEYLTTKK